MEKEVDIKNITKEAKKIAKGIKHELDPITLAHNIVNNPNDFTEQYILALFVKYGEQRVEKMAPHKL